MLVPRGLVPPRYLRFLSPLPQPKECRGPALSPERRGYLEPAPGPASSHRSTSQAATSAATAATVPALSALRGCIRASLCPRGSQSPCPKQRTPLPDPPGGRRRPRPCLPACLPGRLCCLTVSPRPQGRDLGEGRMGPTGAGVLVTWARELVRRTGQGMTLQDLQDPLLCVLLHPLG